MFTCEHALADEKDPEVADVFVSQEPSSYKETLQGEDSKKWQAAMFEEIEPLRGHKARTIVDPSAVKQYLIDCKWVYKTKLETIATKKHYKTRLAAIVFQQRGGIYFNEAYAPVAKMSTIRLLLAMY